MHFDGFDSDGALNRPGGLQLKGVHPGSGIQRFPEFTVSFASLVMAAKLNTSNNV